MRRKPCVDAARIGLAFGEQRAEHRRHPARVDAGPRHIGHTVRVGFRLVVSTELCEKRTTAVLDGGTAGAAVACRRERGAKRHRAIRRLLPFGHLLHAVTPRHVRDFVPDHTGKFRHVRRAIDQAPIHVDVSTRYGKRIDVRLIDDVELPRQISTVRHARDRITKHVDVADDFGIANERQLPVDLRRVVGAHLELLLGRCDAAGRREKAQRHRDETVARARKPHRRWCTPSHIQSRLPNLGIVHRVSRPVVHHAVHHRTRSTLSY